MRYSLIFLMILWSGFLHAQSDKQIQLDAIVVDTHNDFLSKSVEDHFVFDSDLKGLTYSDLARMRAGGINVQMFSIFCDDHYGKGSAFRLAGRELDSLHGIASGK